jgi:aspartate aminotransferase
MDRIVASATVSVSNKVAELTRAGKDIVSFSMGEPDFDTPEHVRRAAKDALDAGHTKYTPGPGIPELRAAIAAVHARDNKIPCGPGNVLVTPTKQAVMMAILAVADHGDEVLLPDPGWVSYDPITRWAHAEPVPVPLAAEEGFRMTPDALAERITKRSVAVVLNSPSNPTGGVNTPADVRGIVELAADHDLWIITDEIYQKLLYDGKHVSPASLPDAFERTITIDGVSKPYAMTGWRVGWAVAPAPAFTEMNKLQSHSVTQATTFAQYGALAALQGPQDCVADMREAFMHRRRIMVDGLRALVGVTCPEPAGAFYAFPHFEQAEPGGSDGSDEALCLRLIEAGVAGTPGSAFGAAGAAHIRFSYAASEARIREGLARLARAL